MPDFTPNARRRVAQATHDVEHWLVGQRQYRGRYQGGLGSFGYIVWLFELLETLPSGVCNQPVLARRRFWDSTGCGGDGRFATSLDAADNCYVADYREAGYCGATGALGAGEYRNPGTPGMPGKYDDGVHGSLPLLMICELNCPSGQTVDCSDFEGSGA